MRFSHCRCLLALALFAALASPSVAQVRELRISHQFAEQTDARDRAARLFVAEVQKRIANIKLSVMPNLAIGVKPAEQLDAVLDGRVEMTVYPLFYGTAKIPELAIGLLPGIPANARLGGLLKGSIFQERLQAVAEARGLHILTWWWLGGGVASRNQPVTAPQSVKGLTSRGGDRAFDLMLSTAGGKILSMPSTDIAKKLASGELDVAFTSFETMVSSRIFEHAKFATLGGYGLWTSLQPIVIAKLEWQKLSNSEKQAFSEAAEISNAYFETTQIDAERLAVEAFNKAGGSVTKLSFEDYAAWLEIARASSWREYEAVSPQADELLTAMMLSFIESGDRQGATNR